MASNVKYVTGESDWNKKLSAANGKLVVVDFSATWCGPCKYIKPIYEEYSNTYTDVVFLAVDEGQNRELILSLGIRSFPTFHFYSNKQKVDEMTGADPSTLKSKIETLRQQVFNPFAGSGSALGSSSSATTSDIRESRIQRLQGLGGSTAPAAPPTPLQLSEDEQLAQAIRLSQQEAEKEDSPKTPDVNQTLLHELLEMGFSDIRSRKSLMATSNTSIEACIQWLSDHQDDPDIDEPIESSQSSEPKKAPLTEEEKKEKIQELNEKIIKRRREREEEEKKHSIQSEIQRREMGKQMHAAREEYEATQRKLQYEKRKKEKEDYKRERERLRQEIAKDKAERMSRGGKLTGSMTRESKSISTQEVEDNRTPEERITDSIEKLRQYRVGNDGLTALKTLKVYVKNILEKPEEGKFRSINLENPAFRKRVSSFVGGIAILLALGFEKTSNGTLEMPLASRNEDLLRFTIDKLASGIESF